MQKLKDRIAKFKADAENFLKTEDLYQITTIGDDSVLKTAPRDYVSKLDNVKADIMAVVRLKMNNPNYSGLMSKNFIVLQVLKDESCFCFLSNCRKIIYAYSVDKNELEAIVNEINKVFTADFDLELKLEKCDNAPFDELMARINNVRQYYIDERGEWTQEFIDALADEYSKISFREFLRQKINVHIIEGLSLVYPIYPPLEGKEWRDKRQENPPKLPKLENCSERFANFFYRSTYIFEQYGIENVVQAQKGDIVIDAGGFIADTAIYFADRVGDTGKVYSFECIPDNLRNAEHNLRINNVHTVEMVNKGLSNKEEVLYFTGNVSNSRSNPNGDIKVETTTIDNFAKERNIKVNFIKSDIEGMELALLQGAKDTIMRDKPICGITLYHKQEDYYVLPKLLKEYCPEYTFYFRTEAEPVVFAVVK